MHELMGVHGAIKHSSRQLDDLCPDVKCIFSLNNIISFLRIYPKEIIVRKQKTTIHMYTHLVVFNSGKLEAT